MTDRYAVIGNPIEQSKSPLIHSTFAQVTGHDIEYTKLLGPLGAFAQTVDAFRAAGAQVVSSAGSSAVAAQLSEDVRKYNLRNPGKEIVYWN